MATGSAVGALDLHTLLDEETSFDGWIEVKKTKTAKVWKKKKEIKGEPRRVKVIFELSGIPPEDAFDLLTNYEVRQKWDDRLLRYQVLESNQDHDTIYWVLKLPSPCDNREFVMRRTIKKEPGLYAALDRSVDHPKAPQKTGLVRGEILVFGGTVRPGEKDNSSRVMFLLQVDLKGKLPKGIVNYVMQSSPLEARDNMMKYYKTKKAEKKN
eukprot:m.57459 g.57459  ORF g.57459 m.57459 type:complete len:211 (+) comp34737_c0_seq3:2-634(+)